MTEQNSRLRPATAEPAAGRAVMGGSYRDWIDGGVTPFEKPV